MINQNRKSLNITKIMFLGIAIIIAIIAEGYFKQINVNYIKNYYSPFMAGEVVKAFPNELILFYGKEFILLAALVFIGYSASNIFEILISTGVFVVLGPIIAIFKDVIKNEFQYDVQDFMIEVMYIGMLVIIALLPYFIKLIIKDKDKRKETLIQLLIIVVGIIAVKALYMLTVPIFYGYSEGTIKNFGLWIMNIIKLSPILISFIALVIFACKAMFGNENIGESINKKIVIPVKGDLCSNCKLPLNAGSKFCMSCGTPANNEIQPTIPLGEEEVLCNNCHKIINKDSKFCLHCGNQTF
jgi:RNA polymerase subunit RPABC4/transcription elongation factor Spt4